MTAALTLFETRSVLDFWQSAKNPNVLKNKKVVKTDFNLPEILFVTSFPPRECGIATYSKDLIDALNNHYENSFKISVCALESENEQHIYPEKPRYILNTDFRNSFVKTAFAISRNSNIKLVVVQHEFGFFAKNKREFSEFISQISQPIAIVFHTVLPNPIGTLKRNIQHIAENVVSIIVMTKNAATLLKEDYKIPEEKITIIAHGTHLVPPADKKQLKEKYQLTNKTILSTFGLLGSSKNIETTLEALPTIVKLYPNVLFLILGKTHPTILKNEGEVYREMLQAKVTSLHLEKHVKFINEYLQLSTLLEYLLLTDVYLFTSNDPNQAVSGTFSYAVSCGCPIVSTPIPHAKEVLSNNNGIIIDFENPTQLSKAVNRLLSNDKLREKISAISLHQMASTAWENSANSHALLFKRLASNSIELTFRLPKINLNHIKNMTTETGMIQFSKIAIPDIKTGFTLDDNARALIAIAQHYELFKDEKDLEFINIYLQFIEYCIKYDGALMNYINADKKFIEQNYDENLEDSNGRAIWALGYIVSLKEILPINITNTADELLEKTLPKTTKIFSTRAMAFVIKGLYYQNDEENFYMIEEFAHRLAQMYKHEKSNNWHWFENYLTYSNSLLPEAMLCAYLRTENKEFKKIALESFDFLLSKIFLENRIQVISNKGWLLRDKATEKSIGGEQPIDVADTIVALENFYHTFQNEDYKEKAVIAFSWFLGNNHLNQIVYNPCTGGCYDGVEEHNVNLNQGAESTLSYLMARLAIQRIHAINSKFNVAKPEKAYETATI